MTEPDGATETSNKALVEAGFDAWSAGTGSPYDLLSDDVTWTITDIPTRRRPISRAAFIDEVIRPFNARMREA